MNSLPETLFVFAAVLVAIAHGESSSVHWCYVNASCNPNVWASTPYGSCNGTRQSPLNINTSSVVGNSSLTAFNFTGFNLKNATDMIMNTGNTVKVNFAMGLVKISGGGLSGTYDVLQFHLHWGNGSDVPGSEHTVDGKQYSMELHIVATKSIFMGNLNLAVNDSEGIAALGFLIEQVNSSSQPDTWKTLTSYLPNITKSGQEVNINLGLSLDDLLVGVNRTQYYRYLGSLTTPMCDQAVVWTVFKDSIKVSTNLINLFSTSLYTSDSTLMISTYRNLQKVNDRTITTQPSGSSPLKTADLLLLLSLGILQVLFKKWSL